jgi:hypothetical protein
LETWLPLIAIAILALSFGGLAYGWWWGHAAARKMILEETGGKVNSFTRTGGVRLDLFRISFPFATIAVTPRRIVIFVTGRTYCFERSSIRSLSKSRSYGVRWPGIRIEHSVAGYPQVIIFSTFNFNDLAGSLERLGWALAQ